MGIYLGVSLFESEFRSLKKPALILNDVIAVDDADKQKLAAQTTTSYDNADVYANDPACSCGETRGAKRLGMYCQNCNTVVEEMFSGEMESRVWIRAPQGVHTLVNPNVWSMLRKAMMRGTTFSLLEWLTNTDYVATTQPVEAQRVIDAGFKRGYNNFINRFDEILQFLIENRLCNYSRLGAIRELVNLERSNIFTSVLPLPNKSLLVIECTPTAKFIDDAASQLLELVRAMTGVDTAVPLLTQRQRENRTAKSLFRMVDYYDYVIRNQIAKKIGWLRKHVLGGRNMFSTRAVISSITDPHNYDEIVIGWGHAVTMLAVHLKSKLIKEYGFTPGKAAAYLNKYTHVYDPLLEKVMQQLFDESPHGGLYGIMVRNPTLTKSSCQCFLVKGFKRDPDDPTISFSILCVAGFNADFDGDQMSLMLALDTKMSNAFADLAPHKNIYAANAPRTLSGVAAMPKPVASTIANMIESNRLTQPTPEQEAFLDALCAA